MDHLRDKVALITGGGQGVGQGIALAMAKAGAKIALVGRTLEKLQASQKLIEQADSKAICIEANVKSADDLKSAVDEAVDQLGGIDILVNNAQEVPLGPLEKVADEAFVAGFESGPLATLRLMKMVHPIMAARGGGVVFNIVTSAAVRWDMSGYGAYGAVKQAMRSLTRAGAAEWGEDNIRVLSIAPHAKSPALNWWVENNPEEAAEFVKSIPLGRIGECEDDIGQAVTMLCAPEMGYLTGATIPLDGGQANFD